ncbi:homeobox protein VENTX [Equus caballus]
MPVPPGYRLAPAPAGIEATDPTRLSAQKPRQGLLSQTSFAPDSGRQQRSLDPPAHAPRGAQGPPAQPCAPPGPPNQQALTSPQLTLRPAPTVYPAEDPRSQPLPSIPGRILSKAVCPAMPPSSPVPSGCKPTSSFGSVDWLSQSSHVERSHTSRPAEDSQENFSAQARGSSRGEPPQTQGEEEVKFSEVSAPGTPTAGLSKEPDTTRAPRVRTAFTVEQVSTLESSFQHRRYLGPLERRRLAREMRLSEVQIKTWFQNRRMKHKRQLQDSQLKVPFSGALYTPLASCPPPSALGDSLQLLYPWASLPGPPALVQPPGFFWGPCQMEQASLPSAWASCSGQPLTCCLPDPGGQVHMLGLALSWGPWGLCALPDIGDAF